MAVYAGLCEGKWKTEEDFAKTFGFEGINRQYRRFAQNLFERILTSTLFLNLSDETKKDHRNIGMEVSRKNAIADILRKYGAINAFFSVAEDCLKLAQDVEDIPTVLSLTNRLRPFYLVNPKHRDKYQAVRKLHDEYWEAMRVEIAITNAYEDFICQYLGKRGFKYKLADLIDQMLEDNSIAKEYPHHLIQFYYQLLQIYSKELRHLWAETLTIIESAEVFFKSKKYVSTSALLIFGNHRVGCLLMLGRLEEAYTISIHNESYAPEGIHNWFKNREIRTAVLFYAQRWTDAWATVKGAMQHQKYKDLTPLDQEAWRLYYGYIVFVLRFKKVTLAEEDMTEVNKFRIISWSNDMTLLSQDKQGSNIPIRILQIMFSMLEGKFDKLEEQIDALHKYRHRHFDRESEHYRTDCFIELLVLLPKYATQPDELHARAQEWLEKLRENPNPIFDQSYETEILQYELAWAWMAEMAIAHERG